MKLSISNIVWGVEHDAIMYKLIKNIEFNGIEIAPTRLFVSNPYDMLMEAKEFSELLKTEYNLAISSIQSIWFGRNENLFNTKSEREFLLNYTKKAVEFASTMECNNMVFGCPRNRVINNMDQYDDAIDFFFTLGEYAKENNTILSIEPNPAIYNTNFINTTMEAVKLCNEVNSAGFKLNVDFGTIIENKESLEVIYKNIDLINHIHISEPNLELIENRRLHNDLAAILKTNAYGGYVSIEMKKQNDMYKIKKIMEYVKEVFA